MTVPSRGGPPRTGSTLLRSRRARIVFGVLLVLLLASQLVPRLSEIYVDWRWFDSVAAGGVWTTQWLTRAAVFAVVALLVGGGVLLALRMAYRFRPVYLPPPGAPDVLARYRAALTTGPRSAVVWGPVVLGLLAGLVAQSQWQTVLLFLNSTPFGRQDPHFGLDVSFYVFQLPFWQLALDWLLVTMVLSFLGSVVANYIFGGIRPGAREGALTRAARVQLVVIAGLFVLVKGAAYWLDRYELLFHAGSTFTGAGYTDVHSVMPAKVFMFAVAMVCAVAFFAATVVRDLRIPALATVLLVFSAVVVGSVWPLAVEQFSVKPNRADKERQYIADNIDATRAAFGIGDDRVEYVTDWGAQVPDGQVASRDTATLSNVRLLDPSVLGPTFTQRQRMLNNFYGFPDSVAVDRYTIDGRTRQYVVAAREVDPDKLEANQRDWVNRHTVYTHGNGFVYAPADAVGEVATDDVTDRGGFPDFHSSDVQSAGAEQPIPVSQPRVYFGPVIAKGDPDYAIVGGEGAPREFDTDSSSYTYDGAGGVGIGGWFSRLAFAAKFKERNILLSSLLGPDSKIMFERDPRERVQKVASWLTTDNTTYPAVVDGRIKWIVDGYTTANSYPYAEAVALDPAAGNRPGDRVSYIRNSVKAVVDAYDGSVTLYASDEQDPVLQTWRKAFPDLVHPASEMSEELRSHLRYPQQLFSLQRSLLARYHVNDPGQFFTNEAFWSVPSDPALKSVVAGPTTATTTPTTGNRAAQPTTGNGAQNSGTAGQSTGGSTATAPQPPNYVLAADPVTGKPAYQLTSALVGYQNDNLAAHLAVSSEPETYGRMTVRVPRSSNPPPDGPNQVLGRMQTDGGVARERNWLTSLKITDGSQLALPLGKDSMLFVEPLYAQIKDQSSAAPKLLRVLVFYGNRVGYDSTLCKALRQVGITADPGTVRTAENATGAGDCGPVNSGQSTSGSTAPSSGTSGGGTQSGSSSPQTRDAAVKALDESLRKVRQAQNGGNLAGLGAALEELQKAVDAYQAAGGATAGGATNGGATEPVPATGGN